VADGETFDDDDECDADQCERCNNFIDRLSFDSAAVEVSWNCPTCGRVTYSKQPHPAFRTPTWREVFASAAFWLAVGATVFGVMWILYGHK
jgi:hypothetical protein